MNKTVIFAALSALLIASCSKQPKGWSVEGQLEGDGQYTLSLEGYNNGLWYVIDSLSTNKGEFAYRSDSPASFPEIMRLGFDGNYIYFPIDSIDNVSISANADAFSSDYSLSGSVQAKTVFAIDSIINASVANNGAILTLSDQNLKHELFTRAFEDPSVISLYYLINKKVGDSPLYDVANPADLRLFGAVAQRFATEAPDDPRGIAIGNAFTKARAAKNPSTITIEVPETSIIDIVRTDAYGIEHSLADMASKGGVVLLSFSAYGLDNSPAYNIILNSLYENYKSKGLDIYQIAFDGDETMWKEKARNLPWTAVWNSTTDGTKVLSDYNVSALPTTFIIDRSGTIAERVDDPTTLPSVIVTYL